MEHIDRIVSGWDSWSADMSSPSVSDAPPGAALHSDAMKLPRRDMGIFGEFPSHDDVVLVNCDVCKQCVKVEAFRAHCSRWHNYKGTPTGAKELAEDELGVLQLGSMEISSVEKIHDALGKESMF